MTEQVEATYNQRMEEHSCCVLIPMYNNASKLKGVLDDVLAYTDHIIVIDDGSTDETPSILERYEHLPNFYTSRFRKNKGKGAALRLGFTIAYDYGYTNAITLDADGQHPASNIPLMLEKLEAEPGSLIVGARNMGQENVPGTSSFGNKFSNFWFTVETGMKLPDTQSGLRLYPLDKLHDTRFYTNKYEFEIEVIVRAAWQNINVTSVPVEVIYPAAGERITHFRKGKDFARISILNTVLVLLALLWHRPKLFWLHVKKKRPREFINDYILNSSESNIKITLSVALGLFMGVAPIWGYQLATLFLLAYLLRLNKAIAVVAANISLPPMIPFIIYGSFKLGGLALPQATATIDFSRQLSFSLLKEHLMQYAVGALMLGVILAVTLGPLTYVMLLLFRKRETQYNTP